MNYTRFPDLFSHTHNHNIKHRIRNILLKHNYTNEIINSFLYKNISMIIIQFNTNSNIPINQLFKSKDSTQIIQDCIIIHKLPKPNLMIPKIINEICINYDKHNAYKMIKYILDNKPKHIKINNKHDYSLVCAFINGNVKIIELLFSHGFLLNSYNTKQIKFHIQEKQKQNQSQHNSLQMTFTNSFNIQHIL